MDKCYDQDLYLYVFEGAESIFSTYELISGHLGHKNSISWYFYPDFSPQNWFLETPQSQFHNKKCTFKYSCPQQEVEKLEWWIEGSFLFHEEVKYFLRRLTLFSISVVNVQKQSSWWVFVKWQKHWRKLPLLHGTLNTGLLVMQWFKTGLGVIHFCAHCPNTGIMMSWNFISTQTVMKRNYACAADYTCSFYPFLK